MGPGGMYVPPFIIFPQKRLNPDLYDGAPIGTLNLHNESGYMTADLFVKWIQHFIDHVRPTADKKALLILDGHSNHKNYQALELAKSKSVVLMCLPAHCTHHLQPLNVGFFGPLHKYYNQTATHCLKENPDPFINFPNFLIMPLKEQLHLKLQQVHSVSGEYRRLTPTFFLTTHFYPV